MIGTVVLVFTGAVLFFGVLNRLCDASVNGTPFWPACLRPGHWRDSPEKRYKRAVEQRAGEYMALGMKPDHARNRAVQEMHAEAHEALNLLEPSPPALRPVNTSAMLFD